MQQLIQEAIDIYDELSKSWTVEKSEQLTAIWDELKKPFAHLYGDRCIGDGVGPGWWPLVLDAYGKISAYMESKPEIRFEVRQLKEKFGGLRLYFDLHSNAEVDDINAVYQDIHDICREAEDKAISTCEFCGKPGHQRDNGWVKTLCDEHDAVQKAKMKRRFK